MKASEILSYISKTELEKLAIEYKVDHQSKKLEGVIMFQLLLISIVSEKRNSLRVMEEFYSSILFQKIAQPKHSKIKYNSISDRLASIDYRYFEAIFNSCCAKFNSDFPEKDKHILAYDSTLVGLSSKLIEQGIHNKNGEKKYVKFSMGFNQIPLSAKVFTAQMYNSEDCALGEAVVECTQPGEKILVFDRGISSRKVYNELGDKESFFVSRLKNHMPPKENVIEQYELKEFQTETLELESDAEVRLFSKRGNPTKHYLRLIKAKEKSSGNPIYFISNIKDLSAKEITEIYRQRWKIEVFFKFIKQELNFGHLMSRKENGIRVTLYMTLIAAILITVYKKNNKLSGYKIPKIKFIQELEREILMDIIERCGGDPLLINSFIPT